MFGLPYTNMAENVLTSHQRNLPQTEMERLLMCLQKITVFFLTTDIAVNYPDV